MREIGHFHHVRLFFLAFHLSVGNVWLEAFPKVDCTHERIDDGDDNQYYSEDSKRCEGFTDWQVAFCEAGVLVHPYEFEKKIGSSTKIESLSQEMSAMVGSAVEVSTMLTIMAIIPTVLSLRVM